MPRKKNVTIALEEPLAENQEVQGAPAEASEVEGAGLPLDSGAADLPPEAGDAGPSPEAETGDFPPEMEAGDFPPSENPYPDIGTGGGGGESAGEGPAPIESADVPDGASPDGNASAEDTPAEDASIEDTRAEDAPPAEGGVPEKSVSPDEVQSADSQYDAVLHEWSGANDAQVQYDEGADDPLVLDSPPGMESDPLPEPEEPITSAEAAPVNDAGDTPPRNARSRRRHGAVTETSAASTAERRSPDRERVLTIEARDEVQSEEDREAAIWHEIQNADWTRRILTGTLDGVEQTESGLTLAVVSYKGFRVAIPIKEMLLYPGKLPNGQEYLETMDRLRRILMTRLGSEIDFVVKGHDNKSRSAVGSRKDAMYRKRQSFYLDKNELGEPMIYEGRVVQARVVAVAEKIIRVEVFGVECAIVARGLSRSWVGDAAEIFNVGDRILVRVLRISGTTVEDLSITVDVQSVFKTGDQDNLKKCIVQGRYAGRVTDVRSGVVYIRLNNGVNAIAHSCYDRRTPGKRDDVSFSVTRLDQEQGVAIGIITRIIKQNL